MIGILTLIGVWFCASILLLLIIGLVKLREVADEIRWIVNGMDNDVNTIIIDTNSIRATLSPTNAEIIFPQPQEEE